MNINYILKNEFSLKDFQVDNTIKLIDEGNTIPFIARYRKEVTGELSDVVLRQLYDRLIYLRNLKSRKEDIIRLIKEQGKLNEDIINSVEKATTLQEIEDIYAPFKPKKRTRATIAKEKGLEPLALDILNKSIDIDTEIKKYINPEKEVNNFEDAIKGACDIIAEIIAEDSYVRKYIRNMALSEGLINTKNSKDEKSVYDMYYDYSESIKTIAPHRILAINRAEKEEYIKVKMEINNEKIIDNINRRYIKDINKECSQYIKNAIEDSYKRLIYPSIEREIRTYLTDIAQERAINVFGKNVKNLLLQPPIKSKVVMGFDPAF
ncbi:MAG TPA: Tex-like N-terminal domain-containing protein, partial [Peptostreptococcaceae bacterium]|nr:Tex-like N-terminal domain-containing protein [Peptostreptococcaceae bacterium]